MRNDMEMEARPVRRRVKKTTEPRGIKQSSKPVEKKVSKTGKGRTEEELHVEKVPRTKITGEQEALEAQKNNKLKKDLTNEKPVITRRLATQKESFGSEKTDNEKIKQDLINKTASDNTTKDNTTKDEKSYKITSIVIVCLEGLALLVIVYFLVRYSIKLSNKEFHMDAMNPQTTQESQDGMETASAGTVNVDNEHFALQCTKVELKNDVDGNPAALIYFTFTNKTSGLLSMEEVFPPKVIQEEQMCETFASLDNPPEELNNRMVQINDGASIEACYAVSLVNKTSPVTLIIHDNYETYTDIGSTTIPLQ